MKFSEKLTKLRKENNLSQEALADKLDVSRQSVSKWESGQTYPEMDKLLTLCKIFNVTLDDLTNDSINYSDVNKKSKNTINSFIDDINMDDIKVNIGEKINEIYKAKDKIIKLYNDNKNKT